MVTAQFGQEMLPLSFQVLPPSAQLLDAKSIVKTIVAKAVLTTKDTSQYLQLPLR